ncbi:peptidoglycan D,D-transpeptidase FtsI family protein [Aquibacillus rhizosphaerae]|uniref:serine-type D-Ala-D-Ala carboxypeptidase n=1 Tax=Aquibacillus rhizosphaerae TaxID=3051431 RepID=A0ABT7L7E3_9BACI|nr:penicillin-binding protein 2 [Aquibacillus sp. LR5S19]MDL4841769.1 penicillin-binding protein 2 [Aquibacillus sp. LR5S19]
MLEIVKKGVNQLKKKKKIQIPFRLNILFIFVFALFSLLIFQLGVVQILNGEEAQQKINKTDNTSSTKPVPRGKMFDRFGRLILDNDPVKAITYTPSKNGESAMDRLDLAEKLSQYITVLKDKKELTDNVRERDKKEYWYLLNTKEAQGRLTKKELEELENGEQYKLMLERITQEDLQAIEWTDEVLNIISIKLELDQASELTPHIVVNEGITEKEYAQVAEHLPELQGIDATTDWKRKPLFDNTFASFIGGITTADEGIPFENREYYLTHGYSRNDRVGTSGLEQEYESVLRGKKEKVQFTINNSEEIVGSEVVMEGQSGNDLVLAMDMELQIAVDQIVEEELQTAMSRNNNGYLEDALVAMMNPQTGEILAMSGVRYDREDGEYKDHSYRVIYDAHQPGSAVKGATLLSGYDSGVVHIGESIQDTAIKIAGTPEKSSYSDYLGSPTDLKAIERSSNVYMFNIALRMSGADYQYNQPLRGFDWNSFQTMRNYFNQFGLGGETGVDLPYEATGVVGQDTIAGKLLDLAIGQYDTYTTLQLAQYVSTIANDGYRIRPHLVNEIRQPEPEKGELGPVVESKNADVLNKVSMDDTYLERVQQGFINVFHGSQGTARGPWEGYEKYKVAGKTGTAQNLQYDDGYETETENLSLVGYAPYDNPEVAFAIVVPKNKPSKSQYAVHHNIGKRIIAKYYELKEEREKNGVDIDLLDKNEDTEE